MVRRALRSRSYRRIKVRVAKSTVTRYEKRKPKIAHCSSCGVALKGVPRERDYVMRNLPLTKKRPSRPFGGVLCSSCTRDKIKESARNK
jgi:large subunit ribosomal protein L34e